MIIDAVEVQAGAEIPLDVCVIGAGAAGIPLPAIPEMSNVWSSLGLAEINTLRGDDPTTEFTAAAAAIREAIAEPPDLIISDIAMPEMNGYELAREIRRTPSLAGVVLVALTGYGQDSDRQMAREAGFDHHLVKPVSADSLCELLSSLPTLRDAEHRG